MASPIPGLDFGVPWPPITNPDEVCGRPVVGFPKTALPPGPPAPLATSAVDAPETVVPPLASSAATVSGDPVVTDVVSVDRVVG